MTPLSELKTAIVIVNYRSHHLLHSALDAESAASAGLTVIIVDNFSDMAERVAVGALCTAHGWLLELSDNDGFGSGMNRGAERAIVAGCKAIVALNPDARADIETLVALGEHVSACPGELVSPRMVDSTGRIHFRGAQVHMRTGQIRSAWAAEDDDLLWRNWLSGACLAYSANVHHQLNGFDDDYFLYWEDVDLSRRAAELGMSLTLRDDLLVVHDEGGTQRERHTRAKSAHYYYYNTRNRLRFAVHHCRDRRQLLSWILNTPNQSLQIWLRGGKRQLISYPQGAIQALRGTVSGLRGALFALAKGPKKGVVR